MLNLGGLILVYVGGAGLGFYIAKGFFDTIHVQLMKPLKLMVQLSGKYLFILDCHFQNQ